RLFSLVDRIPVTGTTGSLALAFALLMAALADLSGSAAIIGAFAAGVVLHDTPQLERIEKSTNALGHFFVPVFFASVGAMVDLEAMLHPSALLLGVVLLVVGVATKFLAGYAPWWIAMRHAVVGAAMVPRGEVGLIFARMGLATAVLTPDLFGALMVMVIGTTFVAPPWLAWLAREHPFAAADADSGQVEDFGTVDDLVSGERPER
ncbi:MAG TPA: cation:proton antiporter, partial [Gemmatimonadales bacterium]|nr:cation:proton antiporter [Gemmatimonadales bacterium]